MEKTTLTIHGALRELKLLDSRIERAIDHLEVVGYKKTSSSTEYNTGKDMDNFTKDAISSFNSVGDLIERRYAIKSAIVQSNATTFVQIGDYTYTVAEAIEKKSAINYEKNLLASIKADLRSAKRRVEENNTKMEEALDKQVYNLTAGDVSKVESVKGFSDMYRADNSWELVNPLGIEEAIERLEIGIGTFLSNVDEALSVSNAITTIEV